MGFTSVVDVGGGMDDAKVVAATMDVVAKKCTNKAILLLSNSGGKLALLANVPKDLASSVSAKAWAGEVLSTIDGKGGGSDLRFQGQGGDSSKLDAALKIAKAYGGTSSGTGEA